MLKKIKKTIEDNKKRYAVIIDNDNSDTMNEIPVNDLHLSIEEPLFFDVLLMEIRGKSIAYSSHKKKK